MSDKEDHNGEDFGSDGRHVKGGDTNSSEPSTATGSWNSNASGAKAEAMEAQHKAEMQELLQIFVAQWDSYDKDGTGLERSQASRRECAQRPLIDLSQVAELITATAAGWEENPPGGWDKVKVDRMRAQAVVVEETTAPRNDQSG